MAMSPLPVVTPFLDQSLVWWFAALQVGDDSRITTSYSNKTQDRNTEVVHFAILGDV